MAELRNEFSWSTSRDRLFTRCRRAYWWRYYGHWGGWSSDAPEAARIAYRLGKQDTFATWGGTILHDTIEVAIKALRDRGAPIELEALRAAARRRLREGWVESRDGHWRRDPKRKLSLWEHYYGGPEDRDRERTEAVEATVYGSLERFTEGPFPALLARVPKAGFRNIEVLDTIEVHGHKVYVKPDLAFDHPDDGLLWLVDWKTGTPKEVDRFQVSTYALFARHRWGVEAARCQAVLAYLGSGEEQRFTVSEADLDAAEARIAASMDAMRAPLSDPANNVARIDDFPRPEEEAVCRRCNFRQLCFGVDGVPGAAMAGDSRQTDLFGR